MKQTQRSLYGNTAIATVKLQQRSLIYKDKKEKSPFIATDASLVKYIPRTIRVAKMNIANTNWPQAGNAQNQTGLFGHTRSNISYQRQQG